MPVIKIQELPAADRVEDPDFFVISQGGVTKKIPRRALDMGAQGNQGHRGYRGERGYQGQTGSGAQGVTGAQGFQGSSDIGGLTGAVTSDLESLLTTQVIAGHVFLGSPVDGIIPVIPKAEFASLITRIRGLKLASGTLTLAVKINGVAVAGLSSLAVTTSSQDAVATTPAAVAIGDRVVFEITDASGTAGLEFTLGGTR